MGELSNAMSELGAGIYLFPVLNCLLMGGFFLLWVYAALHMVTLGGIEQVCLCLAFFFSCVCFLSLSLSIRYGR